MTNVRIEIIREPTPFERETWVFVHADWVDYTAIPFILDGYTLARRETKRHSYKPVAWYTRMDNRGATIRVAHEVPWPDDLEAEVLDRARALVRVVRPKGGE
jgi:hypothetical protein